jgi:type II secretory pathway component PulC
MGFSLKIISPAIVRILFLAAVFLFLVQGEIPSLSAAATPSPSAPRLVGTVQGGPFSGAVFDDGTAQTFYRLHEQLPDGSSIVKVRNDSIVIKKDDGVLYEVFTTGTANSAATAVPSPNVTPSIPSESMPNAAKKRVSKAGRVIGQHNDE